MDRKSPSGELGSRGYQSSFWQVGRAFRVVSSAGNLDVVERGLDVRHTGADVLKVRGDLGDSLRVRRLTRVYFASGIYRAAGVNASSLFDAWLRP
jgi:hypothetical protein